MVAVGRDAALDFYYAASLAHLQRLGVRLCFFSPLESTHLPPDIDGLIIGGGFPEMFAERLEANESLRTEILRAARQGLPIYAECGGYMYLMKRLVDFEGRTFEMCGVFDGTATMTKRLQGLGYVEAHAGDLTMRAHEFRYSVTDIKEDVFECRRLRDGTTFKAGARNLNAVGSYLHTHFCGSPDLARAFVELCVKRR